MLSILARFFTKRVEPAPVQVPDRPSVRAGQKYRISSQLDPWPPKHVSVVKEVRDGWVRYYMNYAFPDERKTVEEFLSIYTLHADPEVKP